MICTHIFVYTSIYIYLDRTPRTCSNEPLTLSNCSEPPDTDVNVPPPVERRDLGTSSTRSEGSVAGTWSSWFVGWVKLGCWFCWSRFMNDASWWVARWYRSHYWYNFCLNMYGSSFTLYIFFWRWMSLMPSIQLALTVWCSIVLC